ncbi:hypothetical protein D9V32_15105 [Mycetocola tolaasinivorans]|uniref:Uncharacterized protein n=1 Tax=Mycetocola tolaasinivorans TaxID=76635 RepID=A0A3L6ZXL5_9MICO|nr:hypothetical protein D9V32_15105 [Mycetocola tolaasinivorans]
MLRLTALVLAGVACFFLALWVTGNGPIPLWVSIGIAPAWGGLGLALISPLRRILPPASAPPLRDADEGDVEESSPTPAC